MPLSPLTLTNRDALGRAEAGRRVGLSWLSRSEWMHRRVDTYEFVDSETVRCDISFHVTIPKHAAVLEEPSKNKQCLVPLMLLAKSAPPFRFQVSDASGRSLPRLRDEECATLEFNFLKAITESIIQREIPRTPWYPEFPAGLTSAFQSITSREPRDGKRTFEEMRKMGWGLSSAQMAQLFGEGDAPPAAFFRISVKVLAGSHMLCALLPGEPGQEFIVKMSSDLPQTWPGKPWRRIMQFMGWVAWEFRTNVSASDPRDYHCEIWVPASVEIDNRSPGLTPVPPHPQVKYLGKSCFQLAASNFEGEYYLLHVKLRAKIGGWLSATLATCLAVLALLLIGKEKCGDLVAAKTVTRVGEGPAINLTVLMTTIFLAVGAAAITILARSSSGKHALDDRMLAGLRGVSWGIVAVCLSAVLILFCAYEERSMRGGFVVLIYVQCVILVFTLLPIAIRTVMTCVRTVKSMDGRTTSRRGLSLR